MPQSPEPYQVRVDLVMTLGGAPDPERAVIRDCLGKEGDRVVVLDPKSRKRVLVHPSRILNS